MFGAGPEERNLRDFIERLDLGDTIRLGGPIGPSELASYLRVVRALIIPSRIESIPLILSDAAQAGCPVIATRVGDVGTLLERFKVGVTVPPESPSALAEAIAGFSPEDSFRPDDAAKLAEHLSIERSVRQFLRDTVR
jgi:glycosyltransferase involved in cell wall biosynthesis